MTAVVNERYIIVANGRRHVYSTLGAAMSVASEIFAKTGVVVGITKEGTDNA